MATFTWSIPLCEHHIETGGINVVHYRCVAEDGDYTASAYGTVGLTPDPDAPDFVPYADVTEAIAQAWVWDSVDQAETEANLASQIEAQKNPTEASGLPWAAE